MQALFHSNISILLFVQFTIAYMMNVPILNNEANLDDESDPYDSDVKTDDVLRLKLFAQACL